MDQFFTFDAGAEGWGITGDARSFAWNPAGYVEAEDTVSGDIYYFVAPDALLGDLSARLGDRFVFEVRQDRTDNGFQAPDLVIEGPAGRLTADAGDQPGTNFTRYGVDLVAGAFTFDDGNGARPATQADLAAVLADVTTLQVRGEYRTGSDFTALDNVGFPTPLDGGAGLFSTFDEGPEGWSVTGDPSDFFWDEAGYVVAEDSVSGDVLYFAAPDRFLGEQTGRIGDSFRFDLRQSRTDTQFDSPDLVIEGTAGRLTADAGANPDTTFTSYEIALAPQNFAFDDGSGAVPATAADIAAVMADVTGLLVRGEYRSGPDTNALDNVGWVGEAGGLAQGLTPEAARLVAYLYEAGLDRDGDIDLPGLNFWIDRREAGLSERDLSRAFLRSEEFEAAFGDALDPADPRYLDDVALVDALYENVLDRAPDAGGRAFWLSVLERPNAEREDLLLAFAISDENVAGSPQVEGLNEIASGEWAFA